MRSWVIALLLAACGGDTEAVRFDDQIEAGSLWRLIPGAGTPGTTIPTCPTFAPMARHVPDDTGDCAPGCTCSLQFYIEDTDDPFGSSTVSSDFQMHCADASQFWCSGDDVENTSDVTCFWNPSSASLDACTYPGQLVEIALAK
jgi:hypothetical protein